MTRTTTLPKLATVADHDVEESRVTDEPEPLTRLDVSDTVEVAIASLREHRVALEGLGDHPMADPEFLRWVLEGAGGRAGCGAAVAVERFGG